MKIKGLLVMPGMEVQKVKIPASIKFIKSLIGNELVKIKATESVSIFIPKEPNMDEFNRIYKGHHILGSFIIVGNKNHKIKSLKNREIRRYYNMFKLSKHKKKVDYYKSEFLEKYYLKQNKLKRKARKENREKIFGLAA